MAAREAKLAEREVMLAAAYPPPPAQTHRGGAHDVGRDAAHAGAVRHGALCFRAKNKRGRRGNKNRLAPAGHATHFVTP